MTLLVTGGSGFVGVHLCQRLLAEGTRLHVLDPRPPPFESHDSCRWFKGHFGEAADLETAMRGCEGIVHLAALSRAGAGADDPKRCVQTNLGDSCELLERVRNQDSPPWLLLASTRSAIGRPAEVYGATKRAMEIMARAYAEQFGLSITCIRFPDVYGSLRDHPGKVLPSFVRQAAQGQPLHVRNPDARFDFVYVDDLVDLVANCILDLRASATGKFRGIHCSSGCETSLRELASIVVEAVGAPLAVEMDATQDAGTVEVSDGIGVDVEPMSWPLHVCRTGLEQGVRRLVSAMSLASNQRTARAEDQTGPESGTRTGVCDDS